MKINFDLNPRFESYVIFLKSESSWKSVNHSLEKIVTHIQLYSFLEKIVTHIQLYSFETSCIFLKHTTEIEKCN